MESKLFVDNSIVKIGDGRQIDRIDRNILFQLQKDGRLSNVELSKR